jgi:hypothetical protein
MRAPAACCDPGFYLSENDVLHIGMFLFIAYLVAIVAKRLRDEAATKA